MSKRLVIRFDGPPSHESGRFIEVELDGASVSYGEWEQDGDYWLLVLPDADAKAAQLEDDLNALIEWVKTDNPIEGREKWYALPKHIKDRLEVYNVTP